MILGDFNIDLNDQSHPASKQLIDFGEKNSLSQLIQYPTRVSKNRGSKIDLIFSDMNNISSAGILQLNFSDHCPIFLVKKKMRASKEFTEFSCRIIGSIDWDSFRSDLQDHEIIYSDVLDASEFWLKLKAHIFRVCNSHCPLITMSRKRVKPDYISNDILVLIHKRDKVLSPPSHQQLRHHLTTLS